MKRALLALTALVVACSTGPIIMVPTFDAMSGSSDVDPPDAGRPRSTKRVADAGTDALAR
jgi:hypothetical protein